MSCSSNEHEDRCARILVVDADESFRDSLSRLLMLQGGYEVSAASDSFEAGYLYARMRPDLVILDLVERGLGGLDICDRIRRLSRQGDAKIIVLTTQPEQEAGETSLLSGADLVLSKPECFKELVIHIEDLLET